MRKEAIVNARIEGTRPYRLKCAKCGKQMLENTPEKEYRVDHIIPASEPASQVKSWDDFFRRLNVPAKTGLQVLCDPCHDVKTRSENAVRRSTAKTRSKRKKIKSIFRIR
jgi:5-methylcytosine-specific restriction endonuclease McrA